MVFFPGNSGISKGTWEYYLSAYSDLVDNWIGGLPISACMSRYGMDMYLYGVQAGSPDIRDRAWSWRISGCIDLTRRDSDYGW